MGLAVGVLLRVAVAPTTATVSAPLATGGSSPYTTQYYKSTSSGFVPGVGNIIAGATSLSLSDTGLNPGVTYYYKQVVIDAAAASVTTAELQLVTVAVPNQNQFAQTTIVGVLDQKYNYNTKVAIVDATSSILTAGQGVKMVDTSGSGPMTVKQVDAVADDCIGFVNYNAKNAFFIPGSAVEISQDGNVMWMIANGAIARGQQVQLDLVYVGGVKAKTGSSGADYVGWAMDKAANGQLLRINLVTPSFTKF